MFIYLWGTGFVSMITDHVKSRRQCVEDDWMVTSVVGVH